MQTNCASVGGGAAVQLSTTNGQLWPTAQFILNTEQLRFTLHRKHFDVIVCLSNDIELDRILSIGGLFPESAQNQIAFQLF